MMLKNVINELNNWAWKFGGKYGYMGQRIIVNSNRTPLKVVFRDVRGVETSYPVKVISNNPITPQNAKRIKISIENDNTFIVDCKSIILR